MATANGDVSTPNEEVYRFIRIAANRGAEVGMGYVSGVSQGIIIYNYGKKED